MGALTAILMYLVFGFLVGMVLGFLREWKPLLLHILMGLLVIFVLISVGTIVLSGIAGGSSLAPYEYVGFVAYFLGLVAGDDAGEMYYEDLMEARE